MKQRDSISVWMSAMAAILLLSVPCGAETTTSDTTTAITESAATTTTTRPVLSALTYEIKNDEATILSFSWLNERVVTIPKEIEGYPVRKIADYAFQYCYADEVILPDTIREIGEHSFMGCAYLQSITIPAECTLIGYSAFSGCSMLKTVVMPETVSEIGYAAFYGTPFLNEITDEFVILGDGILYAYCGEKTDVTIPDTVKTINYYAFADHPTIKSVSIPASVTHILDGAFDQCMELETIRLSSIPEHLQFDAVVNTKWFRDHKEEFLVLGDMLIAYRGQETEVTVPDGIKVIGHSAFEGNPFITTVHVPASVTQIRRAAFYRCTSLQVVTLPDSVQRIDELAFYGCNTLKYINFGTSLQSVGEQAFVSCDVLDSVILPSTVQTMGKQAFGYRLNLEKIDPFTLYSNSDAVKQYAQQESLVCKPLANEETSITKPIVTTTTTIKHSFNAGNPLSSKTWILPTVLGGILVLFAGFTFLLRKKKT